MQARVFRWMPPALLGVVLLSSGMTSPTFGEQMPLSLAQAQQLARTQAHAVRLAEHALDEARGARRQTLGGLLPTIRLTEEWVRTDDAVGAFGARLRQERFTAADLGLDALNEPAAITDFRTSLEIQQPLFNGGAHRSQRRAATEGQRAARAQLTRTRQQMDLAAAEGYWGLALSMQALSLARAGVEAAQGHQNQARIAWENGNIPRSQLLAAELRVAELKADLIDAQHRRDSAADALSRILGLDVSVQIVVTDSLGGLATLDAGNDALGTDIDAGPRADLVAVEAHGRASYQALRAARAGYLPQLNAFARYSLDAQDPFAADGESWMAGAVLSWEIFDGFVTRGSVQQARARAAQAEVAIADLRSRIERDRRDTERQSRSARQRLQVAATAIVSAEENLRVTRLEFEQGIITTTALLDAEVAWRGAHLRHLQALHDVRVSHARRAFAFGLPTAPSPHNR